MTAPDSPATSGGFWRTLRRGYTQPPTARQRAAQAQLQALEQARAIRARHDLRGIRP